MIKAALALFLVLFLGLNAFAGENIHSIELPGDINLSYPENWKVIEEPDNLEIIRLGDERNNAIFSLFLYRIEGTNLEAFAEYMIDYFTQGTWEETGELEERSWEGIEEGLTIRMETALGEDDVLIGHYLFFRVDNSYFFGRVAIAGQVWEEYEEDWEIIRESIRRNQ